MALSSHALFVKDDSAKERKELQGAHGAAFEKRYKEKPAAREEIKSALGYAVFSSIGVNAFLVSTQRGGGILREHRKGKPALSNNEHPGSELAPGEAPTLLWVQPNPAPGRSIVNATIHID